MAHSLGDVADNVADIYDPDQGADTRLIALGLVALDSTGGGKGRAVKGVSKGVVKKPLKEAISSAAQHAKFDRGRFRNETIKDVENLISKTYENHDIKQVIKGVKKYYYDTKTNYLFINNPKQETFFKTGVKYLKNAIKRDLGL